MRPIDADALEKEGWSLHRDIQVDKTTREYQTMPLANVPDIYVGECEDTISRQAAIDALKKHEIELPVYTPREVDVFWDDAIDCCVSEIEDLPSAQPQRKRGEWIIGDDHKLHCSNCGKVPINRIMLQGVLIFDITPIKKMMKFCPSCGAAMSAQTDSE